jgi:ribosome biogenesis GTPase A
MKTVDHWRDVFAAVIKETDFILEVLDARDPEGTHNFMIEHFVQKNRPEISIFLVINKIDLIPDKILKKWVTFFRKQNYRVYYVSSRYNRGISYLLRDLRRIITRPKSNVLIVGYPNTGKSTLIEALTKGKKKVGTSASAGFTRVIQKIRLTETISLLDTPGVIPIDESNETDLAIKACMRSDKMSDPLAVVEEIHRLVEKTQFESLYGIKIGENESLDSIIKKIGQKMGRLVRGGQVNEPEVYKLIIHDWQTNKFRYFRFPPNLSSQEDKNSLNNINSENLSLKIKKPPNSKKNKQNSMKNSLIPPSLNLEKKEKTN